MSSVASHGTEIYYQVNGSGPAIAFAHGAGGNALSWWQQVPHFARSYRVLTFDHRGFGRSRCAPEELRTDWFADDLLAILDAEGIERAALVCQSMGGWTGLRAALEAPERVACLVLCATPGGVASPAVDRARTAIRERVGSAGVLGNVALAPDFPEREPALAFLYDQIGGLNPRERGGLRRLGGSPVGAEQLAGYRVPTLLIAGERDVLFPREALHEVASLIPGAEIRDFAGAGHSAYFEAAPEFNRMVEAFVAKHLPPGAAE